MHQKFAQLIFVFALVGITLSTFGCGSYAISSMPSEDAIPLLAATKQNAARYQNNTIFVPTTLDDNADDVVRIALHETGNDSSDHVLVMIHGVFTDHSSWRYVRGNLVDDYNLWLIDLPGCGDSDSPPVDDRLAQYTPHAMARRVLQTLQHKINQQDSPPKLTLVGHSLAGQIILRALSDPALRDQYSDVLTQINAAVLLAPLDISDPTPQSAFTKIIRLSSNTVNISWNLGLLELRIAQATRNAFPDPNLAPREEALKRLEVLRDTARRQSMQAMLRQAVPTTNGALDRPAVLRIESHYKSIDTPLLILWGKDDNILPLRMAYKLARQIPTAELLIFNNSKHSIHHDSPTVCASIIDSFVRTLAAPLPTTDTIELAVRKSLDRPRATLTSGPSDNSARTGQ